MNMVVIGLVASLLAGLATGLGALPVLLPIQLTDRLQAVLLGFGGGIMLAATSFSLLEPGIEAAIDLGYSVTGAASIMVVGLGMGAGLLWFAHNNFPHEHFFKGKEGPDLQTVKRLWLFIIAIALHNFPEGLAVGVGFGTGDITNGVVLAVGIALQNMPEGLVVAVALRNLNYRPWSAVGWSTVTGLVQPIGGLVGVSIVTLSTAILPWGLAFAAGAMLFVIVDEIIPDIDQKSMGQSGTLGVMTGFAAMMFLDVVLG